MPSRMQSIRLIAMIFSLTVVIAIAAQEPQGPNQAAGPDPAAVADAADVTAEGQKNTKNDKDMSVLDLVLAGGVLMIPIGLCSFVAVTVAIERFFGLRRSRIIPATFLPGLRQLLTNSPNDIQSAVSYCDQSSSVTAHIFRAGIYKLKYGHEAAEKAVEEAAGREIGKLKRSLIPLSAVATVAPLLGLLGTVYGMIEAFQSATSAGRGKADVLAEGIYVALVTTAAGLTLAIPVLIIFIYLNGRVDAMIDDIDESGTDFVDFLEGQQKASAMEAATVPVSSPPPATQPIPPAAAYPAAAQSQPNHDPTAVVPPVSGQPDQTIVSPTMQSSYSQPHPIGPQQGVQMQPPYGQPMAGQPMAGQPIPQPDPNMQAQFGTPQASPPTAPPQQ